MLYDETKITYEGKDFDLSFFKLLEKGKTFYMKFGFDFELVNDEQWIYTAFTNKKIFTSSL